MTKPSFHAGTPEPRIVYAWEGEVDGLRAEIKQLRAALYQIATVCKDNANVTDRGKAMALDFVHQVAASAVNIHKGTE